MGRRDEEEEQPKKKDKPKAPKVPSNRKPTKRCRHAWKGHGANRECSRCGAVGSGVGVTPEQASNGKALRSKTWIKR